MNATQHTPTPWVCRANRISHCGALIGETGGDFYANKVAKEQAFSFPLQSNDNAAHIVRCVNAHDELVADNERLRAALLEIAHAGPGSANDATQWFRVIARAALEVAA